MLLYILLAILVGVLALMFIPVSFSGWGRAADTISGQVVLNWALGLVKAVWLWEEQPKPAFNIYLAGRVQTRTPTGTGRKPKTKAPAKRGGRSRRATIEPWLNRQVLGEMLLLAKRIWASLRLKWHLYGEYSTGDPALTGYIAAGIAFVSPHCDLGLYPRFDREGHDIWGDFSGRLIPAALLWDILRFIFSVPIRNIWLSKLGDKVKINKRRSAYV